MTKETKSILNPNFRLHNEIIDFYNYIKPSEETNQKRMASFNTIKSLLEKEIPTAKLAVFGSFATQVYLPHSDVDIVLVDDSSDVDELLKKTKKVMKKHPEFFENIDVIDAKIKLIKFTAKDSGVEFDISFNEVGGVACAREIIRAMDVYPEIKYLVFIIKLALKQRAMNNTYTGGIGSFLLFLLTLTFLRKFKEERVKQGGRDALANTTLAEYLIQFL